MEKFLFNGEIIIRESGCYTRAHFFRHPKTNRRALLLGMMRCGDPECFSAIKELLSECDCVLFEGSINPDNQPDNNCGKTECGEHCPKTCGECSCRGADDRPPPAPALMQIFYIAALRHLGLSPESGSFDYRAPGWKSAEEPFIARMKNDKNFREELRAKLMSPAISQKRQNEIRLRLLEAIARIAEKKFSRKDFMESFAFLWSDGETVEAFRQILGTMRDESVFEVFDETVMRENPNMIGIKFGAAHIAHQRRLIEDRGYALERSIEIKQFSL